MVKILHFRCRGEGSPPGQGTKILHAAKPEEKKKVLLQDREDKQRFFKKKDRENKKRGGCNTVVANMTLHGRVCLLIDLLKTSEENAKGHLGTKEAKQPQRSRSGQRNP